MIRQRMFVRHFLDLRPKLRNYALRAYRHIFIIDEIAVAIELSSFPSTANALRAPTAQRVWYGVPVRVFCEARSTSDVRSHPRTPRRRLAVTAFHAERSCRMRNLHFENNREQKRARHTMCRAQVVRARSPSWSGQGGPKLNPCRLQSCRRSGIDVPTTGLRQCQRPYYCRQAGNHYGVPKSTEDTAGRDDDCRRNKRCESTDPPVA